MDYSKLKVVELQQLLSERGLKTQGKKQELIDRLQEADQAKPAEKAAPAPKAVEKAAAAAPSGTGPAAVPKAETAQPKAAKVSSAPSEAAAPSKPAGRGVVAASGSALQTLSSEEQCRLRAQRFGLEYAPKSDAAASAKRAAPVAKKGRREAVAEKVSTDHAAAPKDSRRRRGRIVPPADISSESSVARAARFNKS